MQNLLEKELLFNEIINYYSEGESLKETVGLEYERISLDGTNFKQADFNNLTDIIKIFSKENNFELLYDNSTVIGAFDKKGTSVSLEPGGQFEISLAPKSSLYEIQFLMQKYLNQIDNLGDMFNTKFFAIGSNPNNCYHEMKILNKTRYKIMADYLIKKGKFAPVMMRETAGVQINIDYKDELDAELKIKTSLLMSPFLTGFFANSPFRGNKLTKYKSIRALAWKFTGYDRCNLFYGDVLDLKGNLYSNYANSILDVPMIYIERNNNPVLINGKITFRDFMKNGFEGHNAIIKDYILHQSLCFPDVRLKNCIEIRNHDSQNLEVAIGIAAIYKGILYNKKNTEKVLRLLSSLNSFDIEKAGFLAAKFGVNFKIEKLNKYCFEIVEDILSIAKDGLNQDEKKYLNFLIDLIKSRKCIADLVLENIEQNAEKSAYKNY